MCDPGLESWTRRKGEKNKGHYRDSCLHLSKYCGLDDYILSMSTILVLINVLWLYKRMFLETELFRGKKKKYNVSNLLSNGSKNMFLHMHTYTEKKRMTQQIRQYANEWWFWVKDIWEFLVLFYFCIKSWGDPHNTIFTISSDSASKTSPII